MTHSSLTIVFLASTLTMIGGVKLAALTDRYSDPPLCTRSQTYRFNNGSLDSTEFTHPCLMRGLVQTYRCDRDGCEVYSK